MGDGRCLYVFADETGDDRFDEHGTEYFGIAAVSTFTPTASGSAVLDLLYGLQAEGACRRGDASKPIITLHATDDPPDVRERVYDMIESVAGTFDDIRVTYMSKRKMHPAIRSKANMYELVAGELAKYVAKRAASHEVDQVVFAFDQMLSKKEQSAFQKAIKPALKEIGIRYTLLFQQLGHEPNGQISDYIAWAWNRGITQDDLRPLQAMPTVHSTLQEFDIFGRGRVDFY